MGWSLMSALVSAGIMMLRIALFYGPSRDDAGRRRRETAARAMVIGTMFGFVAGGLWTVLAVVEEWPFADISRVLAILGAIGAFVCFALGGRIRDFLGDYVIGYVAVANVVFVVASLFVDAFAA